MGCRCGIRKDDRTADADTIIIHREDAGGDGDFDATSGGGDQSWWHLTDVQFSTVAVLNDNAVLQERIAYDPYGRALHHDDKDIDGDRDFDQDDRDIIDTIVNGGGANIEDAAYNVDADLDRDGAIDSTDQSTANNASDAAALATGELSNATVQNTIGWDGYVFNAETREYLVRYRCYSPTLGRWLQRDPAGYRDGQSLYEYGLSEPIDSLDPTGLYNNGPGVYWTFELDCKQFTTGRVKWDRVEKLVPVNSPVNPPLPPGGWLELGWEIYGVFVDPSITVWRSAGQYWDNFEKYSGSLNGVTCACKWRKKIEKCERCLYQKRRLVYAPRKSGFWPYAWKDEGQPYIERNCWWEATGDHMTTYGTLYRNPFGGRGYRCSCKDPDSLYTALQDMLKHDEIPKGFVERAKEIVDRIR